MKKLFSVIFVLFALLTFSACNHEPAPQEGKTATVDGIVYTLSPDGSSYTLSSADTSAETVITADSIDGIPVTAIGYHAFYENKTVKSVTVRGEVSSISYSAFYNCSSLEEVILPDTVKLIDYKAFADCEKLSEIRLPKALETIGKNAFARCHSLEKVYVNSALSFVDADAFVNCTGMKDVYIEDINAWADIKFANHASTPAGNAENAYLSGELIQEIEFTDVETILPWTFYRFPQLNKVIFGEGVTEIDESAFSKCSSLQSIDVGDTVKSIGTSAFNSCSSLEYVKMGEGLRNVGGLAFFGCNNVKLVDIKNIAAWCTVDFYVDESGTSNPMRHADKIAIGGVEVGDVLEIPEGVKSILSLCFISFRGTDVIIPRSVTFIEANAFYETSIEKIHYLGKGEEFEALVSSGNISSSNFNKYTEIIPYGK